MKIRYLTLFLFCFSLFAQILPLKGDRYDYLVDFDKQKVVCGVKEFSFNSKDKYGYFFVFKGELYRFDREKLFLEGKEEKQIADFKDTILPNSNLLPNSIQDFIKNGFLFLPTQKGFVVFAVKKERVLGELLFDFDKTETDMVLPEIIVKKDFIFLVFLKRIEVFKGFEKVKTLNIPKCLFFNVSVGKDFFTILTVEKPGGLFSIKTVLKAYDFDFDLLHKKELDVFPKNIFRIDGDFVFEKKEVSIFSLFGSKKIHIVKTDMRKGKVKEYSFSLSHKRRHVFPVYYGSKVFLIAQCKDGKVYLLDLNRDKKRLVKKKVYYDYDFLKGKNGGVFYEKNGNNYFSVRFEFSFLSRIF